MIKIDCIINRLLKILISAPILLLLSFLFLHINFTTIYASNSANIIATVSISICGNSIVETGELCDSTNLQGYSCGDFGYSSGNLKCSIACDEFIITSCTNKTGSLYESMIKRDQSPKRIIEKVEEYKGDNTRKGTLFNNTMGSGSLENIKRSSEEVSIRANGKNMDTSNIAVGKKIFVMTYIAPSSFRNNQPIEIVKKLELIPNFENLFQNNGRSPP